MQKIRKSIACLLALVLAVGLMTPYAMAADSPTFTVTNTCTFNEINATTHEGLYVLDFSVQNQRIASGAVFCMKYDSTVWKPYTANMVGFQTTFEPAGDTSPETGKGGAFKVEMPMLGTFNEHNTEKGLLGLVLTCLGGLNPSQTTYFATLYMKLNDGKTEDDLNENSLRIATDDECKDVPFMILTGGAAPGNYFKDENIKAYYVETGATKWTFTYPNSNIQTASYAVTNTCTVQDGLYALKFSLQNYREVSGAVFFMKYDPTVWRPYTLKLVGLQTTFVPAENSSQETGTGGAFVTQAQATGNSFADMLNEHNKENGILAMVQASPTGLIEAGNTISLTTLFMKLNDGKTENDLNANSLRLATDDERNSMPFKVLTADPESGSYFKDGNLTGYAVETGATDWTFTYPNSDNDGVSVIQTANVNITIPAGGQAPSTDIIAVGTGYTAKLTWSNAPATFEYDTEYTANVTLTATNAASLKFGSATNFTVNGAAEGVTKGNVSNDKAEFTYTYKSAPNDPAIGILKTAKATVESATYTTTSQNAATSADAKQALQEQVDALSLGDGVTATVNDGSYSAPVDGTPSDRDGTNGSYTAAVTLSKYSTATQANIDETANVTMSITAQEYRELCLPPVPVCDSSMTMEAPGTTALAANFIYTYKSTQGTIAGTVTLTRQSNDSFMLNEAVDPSTVYSMKAEPQSGYSFMGWTNPNDSNATITGTAAALSNRQPIFKENTITLSNMTVSADDGELYLHGKDSITGFQSGITAYELYLRPEQKELTLEMAVKKSGDAPTLKVDNTELSKSIDNGAAFDTYSYSTTVTGPEKGTQKQVEIELTTADGQTTSYSITVNRLAEDPQILSEINSYSDNLYVVSLKLHKAIVSTFQLKLQIGAFYAAFTDKDGNTLSENEALQNAYLSTNSGFTTKMRLEGKNLTMGFASKDGSYINALNDDVKVAVLYLKTNNVGKATVDDLKNYTVVEQSAILFDQRVGAITSKTIPGIGEDIAPVIVPNTVYIMGYINALAPQHGTCAVTTSSGNPIADADLANDGGFAIELFNGQEYKMVFEMLNYITRTIIVDGSDINAKQAKILLGTYALIAGDIDDDGDVDSADRAELVDKIFATVAPGGEGDINGDGVVNAIDIGYMMANIGKAYPESDKIAVTK